MVDLPFRLGSEGHAAVHAVDRGVVRDMVKVTVDNVDDLVDAILEIAKGACPSSTILIMAIIAHIDRTSVSTLDRQRRLRAAAQALLEEIHDREITQV